MSLKAIEAAEPGLIAENLPQMPPQILAAVKSRALP
jgi:hypothetical protein